MRAHGMSFARIARGMAAMGVAVSGGAVATHAQETGPPMVRVEDGTVDGSFLESYTSRFRLSRDGPDGQPIADGHWTDWVRIVDRYGRKVLEREVARYDADGTMTLWRIHENDLGNLAPIFTYQRFGERLQQAVKMDFDGTRLTVTNRFDPSGPPSTVRIDFDEPVYDLSLWAILLVGFPLRQGYTVRFPVVGARGELVWETMTVDGRETVAVEDGRSVEAWVVSTVVRPWTAWLTNTPPSIAKVVQRLDGGAVVTSTRY